MTVTFVEQYAAGAISDVREDGAFKIALLTPGQGSSAYYSEDLIRNHAPDAFPKGTHVYLDHLKKGESRSPERLVGVLVEDTTVDEVGNAINWLKPISKYREWVEEVRHFVGLSISARGEGRKGEVDGRETIIAESLTPNVTNSVDIVSYAGRGGKFLESLLADEEATRTLQEAGATEGNDSNMTMTAEQATALIESVNALVAKIDAREAAEAEAIAADEQAKADVAEAIAATRLVDSADIAESYKAELHESIANGDYGVEERIAKRVETEAELREELRQEFEAMGFRESIGSSAGNPTNDDTYNVKGW